MNKILIATRNKDKFRIVSKLLSTSLFNEYDYYNLNDLDESIIDLKEIGSITNRSYQKAINVFKKLKKNEFDYIIGIDDGIKMKGSIIENVKDYIKPIINNEFLKDDEIVYILRAYTFINKSGNSHTIITEIPFKYKKISYDLEIKKDSYPLSHVLTPLNSNKSIVEQNFNESNSYYIKYSEIKFQEVKEYFNDNE